MLNWHCLLIKYYLLVAFYEDIIISAVTAMQFTVEDIYLWLIKKRPKLCNDVLLNSIIPTK